MRKSISGYSLISALFIFSMIALLCAVFLAIATQNYYESQHQQNKMLADSLAQSGLQYGSSLVNQGKALPVTPVFPVENNLTMAFQVSQSGNTITSIGMVKDVHGTTLAEVTKQEDLNEETSQVDLNPGFTLVEILIAAGVMLLVSLLFFALFLGGR